MLDLLIHSLLLYIPISFIGLWRWSYWGIRRLSSIFYRPLSTTWPPDKPVPTTSIVVPVYNEDPRIFALALQSWIDNQVQEIVAVIDHTDIRNIYQFQQAQKKTKTKLRLVVTKKSGKRPCLVDGILLSSGAIICLVDSDTIWSPQVLERSLPYFLNPKIGGVAVRQKVYHPQTLSQRLFDFILYLRYNEEVPFLMAMGHVVNTISGRTGIYRREALLNDKYDNMHLLTHEYFLHSRCISGDDKRLTHLILEQGWYIGYQNKAVVYTPGTPDMKTFLKQRLRWTRNSWRADTRAFAHGWVWHHPALAFHNFDRFLQPFFLLYGLSIFVLSLLQREWLLAGIVAAWWILTRFIRLFGYFKDSPEGLWYLPAYLVFSYWTAFIKLYAWFTIVEQGWITRWHSARLKKSRFSTLIQGLSLSILTTLLIFTLSFQWRQYIRTSYRPGTSTLELHQYYSSEKLVALAPPKSEPQLPADSLRAQDFKVYVVRPLDSLTSLSASLNTPIQTLRRINNLADWNHLEPGQRLYYR